MRRIRISLVMLGTRFFFHAIFSFGLFGGNTRDMGRFQADSEVLWMLYGSF